MSGIDEGRLFILTPQSSAFSSVLAKLRRSAWPHGFGTNLVSELCKEFIKRLQLRQIFQSFHDIQASKNGRALDNEEELAAWVVSSHPVRLAVAGQICPHLDLLLTSQYLYQPESRNTHFIRHADPRFARHFNNDSNEYLTCI